MFQMGETCQPMLISIGRHQLYTATAVDVLVIDYFHSYLADSIVRGLMVFSFHGVMLDIH